MKITQQQVKSAYDRLLQDPSLSIRKLAKEYSVSESTLRARLKKYSGIQYGQLNPPTGSLAKLLKQEIIPSLRSDQKAEVTQWMNQNYDLLVQDSGLMTQAQENRLTYLEVPHHHPLDEMIPLSDFLNDRIQEGFTYVPFNPESQVVSKCHDLQEDKAPPQILSSYINIPNLESLLADYFRGTLDDCDRYLDRLYRPLNELNPSNSLWGNITAEEVEECLDQLPLEERAALKFNFDPSIETETLLLSSFYQSAPHTDFNSFIQDQYFTALVHISNDLIQLL